MTSLGTSNQLLYDSVIHFGIDLIRKDSVHLLETSLTENGVRVSCIDVWAFTGKQECAVSSAVGSLNMNNLDVNFLLESDSNTVKYYYIIGIFLLGISGFKKLVEKKNTNLWLNIRSSSLILRNENLLRE